MRLAAECSDQTCQQRDGLRDHADRYEVDEIDQARDGTLMREAIAKDDNETDRTAIPVEDRRAEELAPCHFGCAQRRQTLEVPGAVADFAHDTQRCIARAPYDDDEIIKKNGRGCGPIVAGQTRGKEY